jgi:uncharacterized protein (DUF983 family)
MKTPPMTSDAVGPITPVDESSTAVDKVNLERNSDTKRLCPNCQAGRLAFDGCLNLTCPVCGYTDTGGGFT